MIALALQFPAGRYHATPWGRHVNEGAPEWPPSPWRLLRALVATWKRKLDDELATEEMRELLTTLADPPAFRLPRATVGHTRHYMPWFKKGPDDRTLVFDTFVALDKADEVVAVWSDVVLSPSQRVTLARLLDHVGFFGRAEAWASGRLLSDAEAAGLSRSGPENNEGRHWCRPLAAGVPPGHEIVRVLCADSATAFLDDHVVKIERRSSGRGKARQVEEIQRPIYEPNWNICAETALLHSEKWSDPPGSRWVPYARPVDCFHVAIRRRSNSARKTLRCPTVARFVLDGPVLPRVTETLPLAEMVRVALMGKYKLLRLSQILGRPIRSNADVPTDAPRVRSRVFSGKDADGNKLHGHRHAYYLPTDEDGDGRIDHITLMAEMCFGTDDTLEIKTLDFFRRLKYGDSDPLNLLLVGLGQQSEFRAPLLGKSAVWISATPFLVTRHAKRSGRKRDPANLLGRINERAFVTHVLGEELSRLRQRRIAAGEPFAETWRIEPLCDEQGTSRLGRATRLKLRPIQFKRFRAKRGDDGGRRPAGAFRIVFSEPVAGPICLGHSCHFGLGLFVPLDPTGPGDRSVERNERSRLQDEREQFYSKHGHELHPG